MKQAPIPLPDRIARLVAAALACLLAWHAGTAWLFDAIYPGVFQVGVFLLAACWVLCAGMRIVEARTPPLLLAIAAVPAWGLLQLAVRQTVYRHATWTAVQEWIAWSLVAFLSAQVFAYRGLRRRFLLGLVWFAFAAGVLTVIHWFTSVDRILWFAPNPYARQSSIPFLNHSHFAAFIELALPPALVAAAGARRLGALCAAAATAMITSVFVTASRAGVVLVCAEAAVVLMLLIRRQDFEALHVRKRTIGAVLATAVLVAMFGWQTLWHRQKNPPRDSLRLDFAASSMEMARQRPLLGFGLGTWPWVYPAYARVDPGLFVQHAHNDWLEWTADGGIPLLLIMTVIAFLSFRPAVRSIWGLGVPVVLVHALMDFPLHKPALAALFFAMLGCLAVPRCQGGYQDFAGKERQILRHSYQALLALRRCCFPLFDRHTLTQGELHICGHTNCR